MLKIRDAIRVLVLAASIYISGTVFFIPDCIWLLCPVWRYLCRVQPINLYFLTKHSYPWGAIYMHWFVPFFEQWQAGMKIIQSETEIFFFAFLKCKKCKVQIIVGKGKE